MKMEQTERSETLGFKLQRPGNNPKENIRHSKHGESLKPLTHCRQNLKSHVPLLDLNLRFLTFLLQECIQCHSVLCSLSLYCIPVSFDKSSVSQYYDSTASVLSSWFLMLPLQVQPKLHPRPTCFTCVFGKERWGFGDPLRRNTQKASHYCCDFQLSHLFSLKNGRPEFHTSDFI
jgi:hypothetical protein